MATETQSITRQDAIEALASSFITSLLDEYADEDRIAEQFAWHKTRRIAWLGSDLDLIKSAILRRLGDSTRNRAASEGQALDFFAAEVGWLEDDVDDADR